MFTVFVFNRITSDRINFKWWKLSVNLNDPLSINKIAMFVNIFLLILEKDISKVIWLDGNVYIDENGMFFEVYLTKTYY